MLLLLLWFYWWRAKRILYLPTYPYNTHTYLLYSHTYYVGLQYGLCMEICGTTAEPPSFRTNSETAVYRTLARGQKSRNNNRALTTESVHPRATPIRAETHCAVETITVLQRNPVEEIEIFTTPSHMRIRVTSMYRNLAFI